MAYVLGLDISTTGAKAILVDEFGTVKFSKTNPITSSAPRPLWSEQDPAQWWSQLALSIQQVLAESATTGDEIQAIGVTGQMHGLVLLDGHGDVLRPAILWNDQRTQTQCDEITDQIGFERLIQLTGNRALTGFTAPKILWVREHEPEIYAKIQHILLPKDYIRFKLTGDYVMDMSDASGTNLLDVGKRRWSSDVLSALHIPEQWLPSLAEGTQITGVIHDEASHITRLKAGTPVVGGGGDQASGAVGVGAVEPHILSLALGTSGVVFAPLSQYAYEPEGRLHAFAHAVPHQWHFMGVMLSAAGSFQWFRDTLAPNQSFDQLTQMANAIPAGSEGLYFLPYLTGERTPHPDPLARGAFIGLTTRHTQAHLTRAVLEGVAFGLKDIFELIKMSGLPASFEVRVSGGGAKSMVWQQILADVLNAPLVTSLNTEGAAHGAAILAAVGAHWYENVSQACRSMVRTGATLHPSEASLYYEKPYEIYQSLYPTLKETFTRI